MELFQPWHLILLIGFFVVVPILLITKRGNGRLRQQAASRPISPEPIANSALPMHKFCSECGKQILRRAEICPLCGCRVG